MKHVRLTLSATLLALALSATTFAGDMATPSPTPPAREPIVEDSSPSTDTSGDTVTVDPLTELVWVFFDGMLAAF